MPKRIKNALNVRSRLLKIQIKNPYSNLKLRIKKMGKTTKTHFRLEKRKRMRKGIVPRNTSNHLKVVNIAKDVGGSGVLNHLHLQGVLIGDSLIFDTFVVFFESKIRSLANQARVSVSVYKSHLRSNINKIITNYQIHSAGPRCQKTNRP